MCEYIINAEGGKKVKQTLNATRKVTCEYFFCDKVNASFLKKLFFGGINN